MVMTLSRETYERKNDAASKRPAFNFDCSALSRARVVIVT